MRQVRFDCRDGKPWVACAQRSDQRQMFLHRRWQHFGVERHALELDQPDAQAVHAVDGRDDLVAQRIDDRIVQTPVDGLRCVEQRGRHAARGPPDDVAMRRFERIELGVGRGQCELRDGFLLERDPQLEGIAHQLDVDVGDLQSALRNGAQQAFGLEPWNDFANRAKRQPRQRRQLALRYELPRPDISQQQLLLESFVRLPAQLARHRGRARPRGRASHGTAETGTRPSEASSNLHHACGAVSFACAIIAPQLPWRALVA